MDTTICYGCGLDHAEPQGADGNLDQSQIDWLHFMPDGWDGTPPIVYTDSDGDSRNKLKADINKWLRLDEGSVHDGFDISRRSLRDRIFGYLDRQAAITRQALEGKCTVTYWVRECDKAQDELDRLRKEVEQLKKAQKPNKLRAWFGDKDPYVCVNCGKTIESGKLPRNWDKEFYKPHENSPSYFLGYLCGDCRRYLSEGWIGDYVREWIEKRKQTDEEFRKAMEMYETKDDRPDVDGHPTQMYEDRPAHPDMVNHPPHYTQGGIECIEAIEASMSPEEFAGYLKGNVMKYLWRYRNKGRGTEDLSKAQWYLNKLTEKVEKEDE